MAFRQQMLSEFRIGDAWGRCELDRNCIAHRQIEEIVAFRDVVAPISLPGWVNNPAADENSRNSTTEATI